MKRFKILVDMDDVMENLVECWVNELNNSYGTNVSLSDIREWDMGKFFPTLTKEQVYNPLYSQCFWSKLTPLPGSAKYIKKLIDDGHDVYIVTATHYSNIKYKFDDILIKYFPFISWQNVIITSNKQMIKGDILIDDGVHNLLGGDYIKVLMTAPHNYEFEAESNGMTRVYNWKEIYDYINKLSLK